MFFKNKLIYTNGSLCLFLAGGMSDSNCPEGHGIGRVDEHFMSLSHWETWSGGFLKHIPCFSVLYPG